MFAHICVRVCVCARKCECVWMWEHAMSAARRVNLIPRISVRLHTVTIIIV
jgi:hypothetical protein